MNEEQSGQSPHGRRTRIDKGQRQLIQRDIDVLRLIGEQYTYRFDQLQVLLARHPDSHAANPNLLSETRTRAAIQKWEQLGLAHSRKILHNEAAYVWLSRRGLHHVNLDVAYWEPEHGNLDHYAWINEVRAGCMANFRRNKKYQDYEWEGERLWRAKRERLLKAKKADNSLLVPYAYQGKHRPDGVVHYTWEDGQQYAIAIEVQISVKTAIFYEAAWDDLVRHFIAIWYYVTPEVKPSLLRALEEWQGDENPGYLEAPHNIRDRIYVYDLKKHL